MLNKFSQFKFDLRWEAVPPFAFNMRRQKSIEDRNYR